jgi:hypothetical protein
MKYKKEKNVELIRRKTVTANKICLKSDSEVVECGTKTSSFFQIC